MYNFQKNLHQVIHCLKKEREIPFENIEIERNLNGHRYRGIVLGKIDSKNYIVVKLGVFSNAIFELIYEPSVKELWFEGIGKRKYFYSLEANSEIPKEDYLENIMIEFFKANSCSNSNQSRCSTYSPNIYNLCYSARTGLF